MKKSITPKQIKATNRQLIYRYIYENEKVSQQELSYELHLSRPTVAANLAELEADGLIYRNGLFCEGGLSDRHWRGSDQEADQDDRS